MWLRRRREPNMSNPSIGQVRNLGYEEVVPSSVLLPWLPVESLSTTKSPERKFIHFVVQTRGCMGEDVIYVYKYDACVLSLVPETELEKLWSWVWEWERGGDSREKLWFPSSSSCAM
jgi:hypothetical protein